MKMLFPILAGFLALFPTSRLFAQNCYSSDFVEISKVTYDSDEYTMVLMRRDGKRVRAKYFAAKDNYGNSVYERFANWKRFNESVILLSSGTYMDGSKTPEGLTIESGVMVNGNIIRDRMDALVIVYPDGGIAVSNLDDRDLKVSGAGITPGRRFDLRGSSMDLFDFKRWARAAEATVFQTHLLVYGNELKISSFNSDRTKRERRFLAVGKNDAGELVHLIVHRPEYASLYESSKKTLEFLNQYKYIDVIFMINLDTGNQDVFHLFDKDCSSNYAIKGQLPVTEAVNLLVYYFK